MPFKYFAYGSNMFSPKLKIPAPSATFRAVGRLPGYALRFNKRSEDGSAKANIIATGNANDEILGVIFEIADADRPTLDASEGGYTSLIVEILTGSGPIPALAYTAKADRVSDSLKPYTWYKAFVVRGAREHGLPDAYVEKLEGLDAQKDADNEREKANVAVLSRE